MRDKVRRFLESSLGRNLVLGLIVLNAILIGLGTYPAVEARIGSGLDIIDRVILTLFTIEILLRLWVAKSPKEFLSDGWNVFDVLVVVVCYIPAAGSFASVARILRVLRVLRAASMFPNLRRIVETLIRSLPSIFHIGVLLGILVYTYAVIGTLSFGESDPVHFGTIQDSALSLFQCVTLEGWPDIMGGLRDAHPWCWLYFVTFVLTGTFIVFNLFVGVIVGNLEAMRDEEKAPGEEAERAVEREILTELKALRAEVARLSGKSPSP